MLGKEKATMRTILAGHPEGGIFRVRSLNCGDVPWVIATNPAAPVELPAHPRCYSLIWRPVCVALWKQPDSDPRSVSGPSLSCPRSWTARSRG